MSYLCVSVIVTEQSRILESTILRSEIPLDREEAIAYRDELELWLTTRPIPGQSERDWNPDQASLLAVKLPQILGSRDPKLFSPFYLDSEGDLARVEHRPYDWTRLEAV